MIQYSQILKFLSKQDDAHPMMREMGMRMALLEDFIARIAPLSPWSTTDYANECRALLTDLGLDPWGKR